MATPSLAMIPSAYADSKVYSVLPNNGDGDFTFNRDSSATRVGQNGLIQTVGFFGNELITNGSFDTDSDWTKETGWTISGGKASYNGSASNNGLYQTISVTSGKTYKLSFTVVNYVSGTLIGNISTGATTGGTGNITANGNYSFNITASGGLCIFRSTSSFNGSIDNVSVKEVTGDQPRLNYDISNGVVQSCPSLLLEPASTNVINYSEQASNNTIVNSLTVTDNFAISPDGKQTAFQVNCLAGTFRRIRQIYSVSAGSAYAMSFFVKKSLTPVSTYTGMGMVWQGGTQKVNYIIVDEFNGTLTVLQDQTLNLTTKVEDSGQYWRFSVGATDTGSNTSFEAAFYGCLSNNGSSIGDGAKIWIGWGLQVEALTYPTSYIPTNGASQTRAAETCFGAGNAATFNSTEGVLYAEIAALVDSTSGGVRRLSLSDETNDNRIQILFTTTVGKISVVVKSGGLFQIDTGFSGYNTTDLNKIAIRYGSGVFKVYINGLSVFNDAGVSFTSISLDDLRFSNPSGSEFMFARCKDIRVYNEALTDAQLQTLTTL